MTEIRVLVGTTDFERSDSFYGGLLGFAVAEQWDGPDGRGTLYRAASGGVIEIFEDSPHHPFEPPAGVKVAIEVDDAAELFRRLATADVEIVDPIGERPWGHRNFEIRDPSGLHLVFFSPSDRNGHPAGEG
jgi:catechol 2,3-dioxygenase-like lactoylglutathione lyase family enzyme